MDQPQMMGTFNSWLDLAKKFVLWIVIAFGAGYLTGVASNVEESAYCQCPSATSNNSDVQ